MTKSERKKTIGKIKAAHITYLVRIGSSQHAEALRARLHNLALKFRGFLRKADGSENGLKVIPVLAGLMFGLSEDVRRFRLSAISFDVEAKEMNRSLIAALDARIKSKYFGQCASYGEAILNCYLDLFITFTVRGTPKNLGVKPGFLVNPATGALLELDVLFEDFRLAFEFQGEHHYTNPKDQRKDQIKLATCAAHRRILVPVNIGQLNGPHLALLIGNSMKDQLGLHDVLTLRNPSVFAQGGVSPQQLLQFSKAIQRIYLATTIFDESLTWIDGKAQDYVAKQLASSPISATTAAPRQIAAVGDLDVATIYRGIRHITAIRKQIRPQRHDAKLLRPPPVAVIGDEREIQRGRESLKRRKAPGRYF